MRTLSERRFTARISKVAFVDRCSIFGCGNPTMGAEGVGLAGFHCRKHVEHKARHGSHWHRTYSAIELKPYLRAATSYVRSKVHADKFISTALTTIALTLEESGPSEIATRLKGMSTTKRAKIALARLRIAGIEPDRIVAIILAVTALIAEDPGSHRTEEFRIVQIAKAVHRLASGYHRVWDFEDHLGRMRKIQLHAFPRSSGPVLRIIGRMLKEPCEFVVERHLAAILALKVERYGRHPSLSLGA